MSVTLACLKVMGDLNTVYICMAVSGSITISMLSNKKLFCKLAYIFKENITAFPDLTKTFMLPISQRLFDIFETLPDDYLH